MPTEVSKVEMDEDLNETPICPDCASRGQSRRLKTTNYRSVKNFFIKINHFFLRSRNIRNNFYDNVSVTRGTPTKIWRCVSDKCSYNLKEPVLAILPEIVTEMEVEPTIPVSVVFSGPFSGTLIFMVIF